MKKILLSLVVAAFAWACTTDDTTTNTPQVGGETTTIDAEYVEVRTHMADDGFKVLWSQDDVIGVILSDDTVVPFTLIDEYAGKARGRFEGNLPEGAEIKGAVYPYSEAGVAIASEQSVATGSNDISKGDVATATYENGLLFFTTKVSMFAVSFKNIEGSMIEGKKIQTVKVAVSDKPLSGKFKYDLANPEAALTSTEGYQYADLVYTDAATLSAETKGFLMVYPNITKNSSIRIYVKADDVWYGYTTEAKADLVAGKRYNFAIDAASCKYVPALSWAWGGEGVIPRFTGVCPAVDKDGNTYVTVNAHNYLYKINKSGELVWKVKLTDETGSDYTKASPSIDPSGDVIYIQNGKNALFAINAADGSVKWKFTDFFAYGSATAAGTPNAKTNYTAVAVGDTNIYVGNGGTTGSIVVVNKETGKRVSYLSNSATDVGGPSGGSASGLALYGGVVMAYNKNIAAHGAHQSLLDNPVHNHSVYGAYTPMTFEAQYSWAFQNDRGGVVGLEIDGKPSVAFMGMEKTGAGATHWHIVARNITSLDTNYPDISARANNYDYKFRLDNVNSDNNEQGLIVGPQNELIITNKNGGSSNAGGVYGIQLGSAGNKLLWKFIPDNECDCVGGVVVDNAGNVHVHSDDSYYYVIKPDYTTGGATKLAKVMYSELAGDFGFTTTGKYGWTRAWTSGTIGLDGKVYIGSQFNVKSGGNCGMLLCIEYGESTGVGNTSWPMMYGNPYHTCTSYPELLQKLGM